jgi:hypothetical protein
MNDSNLPSSSTNYLFRFIINSYRFLNSQFGPIKSGANKLFFLSSSILRDKSNVDF